MVPSLLLLALLSLPLPRAAAPPPSPPPGLPQIAVPLVERMPRLPAPWLPTDWRALARNQTRLVFDAAREGEHFPLLWWDDRRHNFNQTTFGVASYVGGSAGGSAGHEAITGFGLVLSAFMTQTDMRCLSGPGFVCVDFEKMLLNYFDVDDGAHVWKDNSDASADGEFWYQIWMSMLPLMIAHTSRSGTLDPWVVNASTTWLDIERQLGGGEGALPDYNCTGVRFADGGRSASCFQNGVFVEPVASAGLAFLHYATRAMVGEDTPAGAAQLQGAVWAMNFLTTRIPYDPFWEVLLPHAVYTSARMHAERVAHYDTDMLLNWVLQDDKCPGRAPFRGGWGVEQDSWGAGGASAVDVDGLLGSVLDRDGYAFAMDTFVLVASLLPVARYNSSYARAIGKWATNAANAARLFFPLSLPPEQQTDWGWVSANGAEALAYEGVRKWGFNVTSPDRNNITGPYGTGDAKWGSPPLPTNLALYGGAYVGLMGACVQQTDADAVLAFDLTATDYFACPSFPSTLLYNPGAAPALIALPPLAAGAAFDVYDAAAQDVVARGCAGDACRVQVAADAAGVFVRVPAGAELSFDAANGWLLAAGRVIDFASSGLPPEAGPSQPR